MKTHTSVQGMFLRSCSRLQSNIVIVSCDPRAQIYSQLRCRLRIHVLSLFRPPPTQPNIQNWTPCVCRASLTAVPAHSFPYREGLIDRDREGEGRRDGEGLGGVGCVEVVVNAGWIRPGPGRWGVLVFGLWSVDAEAERREGSKAGEKLWLCSLKGIWAFTLTIFLCW